MHISFLVCGLFFAVFTIAAADLYQWTDESGVIHVVDESRQIPHTYREKVKVFESQKSRTPPSSLPLSPSRTYPTHSQGTLRRNWLFILGLIKSRQEDAMGPLTGAGIRPASSWQVNDPLRPETIDEVIDPARRAADAQRLSLSADGVEAIVQQAAAAILPPPPPVQEQAREEPLPQQIIIHQTPSQIIEVERETVPCVCTGASSAALSAPSPLSSPSLPSAQSSPWGWSLCAILTVGPTYRALVCATIADTELSAWAAYEHSWSDSYAIRCVTHAIRCVTHAVWHRPPRYATFVRAMKERRKP